MPLTTKIIDYSFDLTGIGYVGEKAYTFKYANIGDEIEFEILGRGKRKYFKVLRHTKSNSVDAGCEYFERCGGCRARNISYPLQFELKTKEILKQFKEQFQIELEKVPAQKTEHYRNRMDFAVFPGMIGLRQEGNFRRIVDINKCNIQKDRANIELEQLRELLIPYAFNRKTLEGFLKYLTLRVSEKNELISILTFTKSFRDHPQESELIVHIQEKSTADSVLFCYNNEKSEVSVSDDYKIIKGREYYLEYFNDQKWNVPFNSFSQPNLNGFEPILNFIHNKIQTSNKKRMIDLFCGSGFFSIIFGKSFDELIGYDITKSSVEMANRVLRDLYSLKKVDFHQKDLYQIKDSLIFDEMGCDSILIMDPPRNGIGQEMIQTLELSKIDEIIYVSCNPNSQLKDLESLTKAYSIESGLITDPYPHTPHLESVLYLKRR
jgi:tRNA (uracil-5-)-methyltransferase